MITISGNSTIRRVGFIGVGRMGRPMVRHLAQAGFSVTAYDNVAAQIAPLTEYGVALASTTEAAARDAEVIILMLPTDEALQAVMEAPDGLLPMLRAGQVVIDMATSQLATSRRLAALVAERGASMLDAPVSGQIHGAETGTLSIMVGGDRATFERCRPVFEAMGTTVTYIGANGMGLVTKLVNQMLMEASFCAVAEAFTFAAKAGADLQAVFDAVRNGLGGSKVLEQMLPQILADDFGSGRELTLHWKDGGYAVDAAAAVGAWAPITELTHQLFAAAIAAGHGDESGPAVVRVFEERAGIRLRRP